MHAQSPHTRWVHVHGTGTTDAPALRTQRARADGRQPTRVTTGAEVGAGEDLDPDVFLGDHATAVVKISTSVVEISVVPKYNTGVRRGSAELLKVLLYVGFRLYAYGSRAFVPW